MIKCQVFIIITGELLPESDGSCYLDPLNKDIETKVEIYLEENLNISGVSCEKTFAWQLIKVSYRNEIGFI